MPVVRLTTTLPFPLANIVRPTTSAISTADYRQKSFRHCRRQLCFVGALREAPSKHSVTHELVEIEMFSDFELLTDDCEQLTAFATLGITVTQFAHLTRGKTHGHCRARHGVAYRPSKCGHNGITATIRPSKRWHKTSTCDAHPVAKRD